MRWLLPLSLGLISLGFIIFTGHVSVNFVLDRFGHNPFWIVLSVIAIAIEVLGAVAIAELARRKRFVTAMFGVPFLALAVAATVSFEIGKFAQASSDGIASRQFEADAFEGNRQALAALRRKRDTALKKGGPRLPQNIRPVSTG